MDNKVRIKLCELIKKNGCLIYEDSKRCEAFLKDVCGDARREINVLVGALKEGVVNDLIILSENHVPIEIIIKRLVKRLEDNLAISEDSAYWAVESWALALEKIPSNYIERQNKNFKNLIKISNIGKKT